MVIHDESRLMTIPPVIKKPLFEPLSHNIVENYRLESENTNNYDCPMSEITKKSQELSENDSDGKVRISRKRSKKNYHLSVNSDSSSSNNKISLEDLEELKTVYKKCKSVIKKIEKKYGHLLELNEPETKNKRRRNNTNNSSDDETTECQCTLNKKIVFDDDGKEIAIDIPIEHICPKKSRYSQPHISQPSNDLQIEYFHQLIELPDCLQELKTILQNPEIDINYRNQVIQKVKAIKQEFAYDIKFNKHSIIEKIKTNMEDMIDFKGANLSSLPGYIY